MPEEKEFSPLPTKSPAPPPVPLGQNQEADDEKDYVARDIVTQAVNAARSGEIEASQTWSLIAISITLHAIWEILNKKDTPMPEKEETE